MKIKDKVRFGLILITLLQAGIIYWLWNKTCPPCFEAGQTVVETKIIHPKDTAPKVISEVTPVPVRSFPKKKVIRKAVVETSSVTDSTLLPAASAAISVSADSSAVPVGASASPCDTINVYEQDTTVSDTTWKKSLLRKRAIESIYSYRIIVYDSVEGKILLRRLSYQNLTDVVNTTITHVKKEKWKVYVGGAFTYNSIHQERWGAGPKAAVAIPKIGEVDYYFDAKNMAHTVGVMALIRFKK